MHCYALVIPFVGRIDVFPYYGPALPGSQWKRYPGELEVIIQNRWHVLWTPRKRGVCTHQGEVPNAHHKPGKPGEAHA